MTQADRARRRRRRPRGRRPGPRRRRRADPHRRPVALPRPQRGGPGDPVVHERARQPRRHGRGARRPTAPALARRAGPRPAGRLVRAPPPGRPAARPARRGAPVGDAGTASGAWLRQLAGPADPRSPRDGGRAAAHDRPARRHAVPVDGPARRSLAARAAPGPAPPGPPPAEDDEEDSLESAYCAEVVAVTYEDMGLLPRDGAGRTGTTPAGSGAVTASRCARATPGGEIAVVLPPD